MPSKTKSVKAVKTDEVSAEKTKTVSEPKFKVETTEPHTPTSEAINSGKNPITSFSMLDSKKTSGDEGKADTENVTAKEQVFEVNDDSPVDDNKQNQSPLPATKSILDPETENSEEESLPSKNEQISSEEVKEWLKDVRPDTSVDVEKGKGSALKVFLFLFIILLIIGSVVGGIFYFKANKEKVSVTLPKLSSNNNSPTIAPTNTPIPTKVPEVDPKELTKLTVSVLNGNGIPGEAAKVKTLLKNLKFKDIKVGNADSSDFVSTAVSMKSSVPEGVFDKIKDALKDAYTVVKSDGALENSSSTDIVIIIGAKK